MSTKAIQLTALHTHGYPVGQKHNDPILTNDTCSAKDKSRIAPGLRQSGDRVKVRRHRAATKKSVRSDEEEWDPTRQLQRATESTKDVEDELAKMQSDLRAAQQELAQVQKEREILGGQRRVLRAVGGPQGSQGPQTPVCVQPQHGSLPQPPQLESWRNEQLLRLQEEVDAKVLENSDLRAQVDRLKKSVEDYEARAREQEQRLRMLESQNNKTQASREAALEQQQALDELRQRYEESQFEAEELRRWIEDQAGHLHGYQNKYLAAQQQVEEQRRHIEQLEAEQDRIGDQVQAELHRAKAEFEERLQEFAPLPDILKATQSKMSEEKQQRQVAEHNCADLNHELASALERLQENEKEMTTLLAQQQSWIDERQLLLSGVDAYERKCNKLKDEIKWYKQGMEQLEQAGAHSDKLYEDTVLELAKVRAELEAAREQAARQAARLRDQMDTMRRSFDTQISELEHELAVSRASTAAARKDADKLRLQAEFSNMSQSFSEAQERIKNLQSVVDVLKNNVLTVGIIDKPTLDSAPRT